MNEFFIRILGSDLPRERAARLLEEQVERVRGSGGEVEGAHLRHGARGHARGQPIAHDDTHRPTP